MSWFEDKLPAESLAYFQTQKNVGMFTDSACRKPAQLEFQLRWQSAPTESQSGQRAAPKSQPVPSWGLLASCVQQVGKWAQHNKHISGEARDGRRSWDNQKLDVELERNPWLCLDGSFGAFLRRMRRAQALSFCALWWQTKEWRQRGHPCAPCMGRTVPVLCRGPTVGTWDAQVGTAGEILPLPPLTESVTAFSPNNICPHGTDEGGKNPPVHSPSKSTTLS